MGQRHPAHDELQAVHHQARRPEGAENSDASRRHDGRHFQALGAATQQISFGELYIALQQGVVDGQENPLANIYSAKLHEVSKFISLTAHIWQSTPFLMSHISTRKVKPAELDIIKAAAKEAGAMQRKR